MDDDGPSYVQPSFFFHSDAGSRFYQQDIVGERQKAKIPVKK